LPVAVVKRAQRVIILCSLMMSVVVTPWFNMDPINLPKQSILILVSFYLIAILLPQIRKSSLPNDRTNLVTVLLFIFVLFLVYFIGGKGSFLQFYGAFGRSTGFITYFSLALIFYVSIKVMNQDSSTKLLWALISAASLNCLYGLFQFFQFDPIDWNNPYNPILGTFGNPNFMSAFLGFAALASLAFLLGPSLPMVVKVFLIAEISASLILIFLSDSSQGLLIFILGASITFYYRFISGNSRTYLRYSYVSTFCVVLFLGLIALFNKGPLAPFLYQDSITFRGDYWRAGWNMTVANPIFGLGLDSYGNWYRFHRTAEATLRRGPDIVTDSAHNVLLDISSNGGVLLLFSYLLLMALVIRSAFRVVRKSKNFDAVGIGLITSWLAYQVQSIISINQLGLAIWGWVLGGAIIGYDIQGREVFIHREEKVMKQVPIKSLISGIVGLGLGALIAGLPLLKDFAFREAVKSGNAANIEKVAGRFPENTYYYIYLSEIYLSNKINDKALRNAKRAISLNPRDFNAWKVLSANPSLIESERVGIRSKMQELDPFNESLKE